MWWFLVMTFGASMVPVYVMPQGPFHSSAECEAVRAEVSKIIRTHDRSVETISCWMAK